MQQNYCAAQEGTLWSSWQGRHAGKAAKATVATSMEVAATAGATITATVVHDHTGEMTTKVTTTIGEIEAVHTGPHGTEEDETHE